MADLGLDLASQTGQTAIENAIRSMATIIGNSLYNIMNGTVERKDSVEITIPASDDSAWNDNFITITVQGVTANTTQLILPIAIVPGNDLEDLIANNDRLNELEIYDSSQDTNSITLYVKNPPDTATKARCYIYEFNEVSP